MVSRARQVAATLSHRSTHDAWAAKGFSVEKRVARQFTEWYVRLSNRRARRTIHIGNDLWFKYVKSPRLAFGNILVLRRSMQDH